ncbi:hypothetical protein C8R45DRAFT_807690 [Mycena sanguinolenta]|nr:hypothetical protein C8R45DRAFT_807690 [Mycena sanguinolenta]
MAKNATIEAVSGKLPVVLEGKCMQDVLRHFEVAFANYCTLKALKEDTEKMAVAVGCFRDHKITDRLEMEEERPCILEMKFKDFMTALGKRVLPKNWERHARLAMNLHRQQTDESFLDFQTTVRSQNSLLMNTDSYLDDDRLCNLLETNMLLELQEDYVADTTAKNETDFLQWLEEVERVDTTRTHQNARLHSIAEQRECDRDRERKRNATNDGGSDHPPKRNGGSSNSNSGTASSSSSQGSGGGARQRCPKFTSAKADLLNAHHGCRKCRKPYIAHAYDTNKTCKFPLGANYKPVTQAMINAALAGLTPEQRRQFDLPPTSQTKPPITAVLNRNVAPNVAAATLGDVEDPNDSGTTDEGFSEHVVLPIVPPTSSGTSAWKVPCQICPYHIVD